MTGLPEHTKNAAGMRNLSAWFIVLFAVFLIYGVNLFFPRCLWIQDEARYGEVAREMSINGTYMVPTLDGDFYPDKPPLYFWALVLQAKMTGLNAFSFRLVTVLSLLGFAAAFYVFSRRLIGVNRATWATLIALTSMLFLVVGNIVRMDILMTIFVIMSLHYFMRSVDERNSLLSIWGYGYAILAVMVKGPLGLAFPFLGAIPYAMIQGGRKGLGQLRLLHGLGFILLVAALWTGYLYFAGQKAYLENVFVTQLWGRSVKSWSHPEPFYFYALVLLPLLMPWTPFLWRSFRQAPRNIRYVFLCWFLPGFLLISAISGKLFIYLTPVFPALALLIASGLPAPWEKRTGNFSIWPGLLNGLFFIILGGGILYALFTRLPHEKGHLAIVAIAPILAGIGIIILTRRRNEKSLVVMLLLGSGLVSWIGLGWGASQLNDYLSTQKLGAAFAEARNAGYEPVAVDIARGTISFYAGTIIRNITHNELLKALDEPGLLAVAVRNKRRDRLPEDALARLTVLANFPKLNFSGYTLYVEKPETAPSLGSRLFQIHCQM